MPVCVGVARSETAGVRAYLLGALTSATRFSNPCWRGVAVDVEEFCGGLPSACSPDHRRHHLPGCARTIRPRLSRSWAKTVSRNAESMSRTPSSRAALQLDICLADGRDASHLSLCVPEPWAGTRRLVVWMEKKKIEEEVDSRRSGRNRVEVGQNRSQAKNASKLLVVESNSGGAGRRHPLALARQLMTGLSC